MLAALVAVAGSPMPTSRASCTLHAGTPQPSWPSLSSQRCHDSNWHTPFSRIDALSVASGSPAPARTTQRSASIGTVRFTAFLPETDVARYTIAASRAPAAARPSARSVRAIRGRGLASTVACRTTGTRRKRRSSQRWPIHAAYCRGACAALRRGGARAVEVAKPFVAFQQFFQLLRHRRGIAGHEHPQVLHSRAHARVVEVDEMRAGVGPQHVAGVAVTMKSQRRDIACAIERAAHAVERVCADARIDIAQVGRQVAVLEQPGARRISEAGDIERRPFREGSLRAGRVNPREKATQPFERAGTVELGRAAAAPRIDGDTKAGLFVLRAASKRERATTGISASASSTTNACSSAICASLQRPGR